LDKEGIYTTGEFGLQPLPFKPIKIHWEDSTVNLEHSPCLFGKLYSNLLILTQGDMSPNSFHFIKSTQVDLIHLEVISANILSKQLTFSWMCLTVV